MALVWGSQTILPSSLETGRTTPFPALCCDLSPPPQRRSPYIDTKSPLPSALEPAPSTGGSESTPGTEQGTDAPPFHVEFSYPLSESQTLTSYQTLLLPSLVIK